MFAQMYLREMSFCSLTTKFTETEYYYGGLILAGVGDNDVVATDVAEEVVENDASDEDDDDVKSSMTLVRLGNVAKPIAKMMTSTITITKTALSIST